MRWSMLIVFWGAFLMADQGASQDCKTELEGMRQGHHTQMRALEDRYERKLLSMESLLEDARRDHKQEREMLKQANEQIEALQQVVADQKRHMQTLSFPQDTMPKLVPKNAKSTTDIPQVASLDKTIFFEAATFVTTEDVHVCDAPSGSTIEVWMGGTSFTSNQKRGGWIRVTGYFVDRKWRPGRHMNLWIDAGSVRRK